MDSEINFGPVHFIRGKHKSIYPYCNSIYVKGGGVVIDPSSNRERLEEIRREEPIDMVFLSHWHEDHSKYMHLFEDVTLCMHPLDAPPLSDLDLFIDWYMHDRKTHKESREFWVKVLEKEFRFKPRTPGKYLNDGDILDLGVASVEVIHTPGHSPGGLSFYFREEGVLFTGDLDLTSFGPWYGDLYSDIDQIISSVEKLRNIPAKFVLAGHQKGVFDGNPGHLWDKYLGVIQERENKLIDFLNEPRDMTDIMNARIIYGRQKEPAADFDLIETVSMKKHLDILIRKGIARFDGEKYHRL